MRMVARDRVVGQAPHEVRPALRRRVLKGADANVARRDADQHRARQQRLSHDVLAGRHDGERPRRRDAQRMHGLADHVLAQHRADGRLPVAAARERRAPRALQVQVATAPVDVEHLAEQQRPTVAEPRRVPAELMAGVRLGHRRRGFERRVADEHVDPVRRAQRIGIDAQLAGQLLVERQQPGRRRRHRLPRRVQAFELADEGVVEREQRLGGNAHRTQANEAATLAVRDDGGHGVRRRPRLPDPRAARLGPGHHREADVRGLGVPRRAPHGRRGERPGRPDGARRPGRDRRSRHTTACRAVSRCAAARQEAGCASTPKACSPTPSSSRG